MVQVERAQVQQCLKMKKKKKNHLIYGEQIVAHFLSERERTERKRLHQREEFKNAGESTEAVVLAEVAGA